MIALATGVLGLQVLAAVLAWLLSPWFVTAWLLAVAWLAWWVWLAVGGIPERIAGGFRRRLAALLLALGPLLASGSWCLGGWWGWWPEVDAAAVVLQGLLMPMAPVLAMVPSADLTVAPYLWVAALMPWIMTVGLITAGLARRRRLAL